MDLTNQKLVTSSAPAVFWPISDTSGSFTVITKRLIEQSTHPIIQHFRKAIINREGHQEFLIAMASALLMTFNRQFTVLGVFISSRMSDTSISLMRPATIFGSLQF